MNKSVAKAVLALIGDVPYADKRLGLVQAATKVYSSLEPDNGAPETKTFPISAYATVSECSASDTSLYDGVPDEKFKGILYFEDGSIQYIESHGDGNRYESRIRLVGWLNVNRSIGNYRDDYVQIIVNDILKRILRNPSTIGAFKKFRVTSVRMAEHSAAIFSKYDFVEERTQYLLPPFDFFAMDLEIQYSISESCLESLDFLPGDQVVC